jgi:hypothetical protein
VLSPSKITPPARYTFLARRLNRHRYHLTALAGGGDPLCGNDDEVSEQTMEYLRGEFTPAEKVCRECYALAGAPFPYPDPGPAPEIVPGEVELRWHLPDGAAEPEQVLMRRRATRGWESAVPVETARSRVFTCYLFSYPTREEAIAAQLAIEEKRLAPEIAYVQRLRDALRGGRAAGGQPRLDAIAARLEVATPAPWGYGSNFVSTPGPNGRFVAMSPKPDDPYAAPQQAGNLAFICHARADVPDLLKVARAAREVLDAAPAAQADTPVAWMAALQNLAAVLDSLDG